MPTKTEQADLLQALYGRNGEAPVPVIAAKSSTDCFETAIEACRIAVKYRTPVIMLSDGYLANGAEPWRIPDLDAIAPIEPGFATGPNGTDADGQGRVPALPARPRDAGPRLGHPRHPRPRAPHRRHREGGRHRQRVLRPGQPRADGPHPAGQGRRHRRATSPTSSSTTPSGHGARAGARLGVHLRTHHGRRPPRPAKRPRASPWRTCATSTPCPPTSARCCAPTTRWWSRR